MEKLGNATWEDKITDKTTHLVTADGQRTMNLIRGIMKGLFIMKYDWLLKSEECGKWQREGIFEYPGISEPAQVSFNSNKK